jgi:hypothetical protein
VNRARFLLGLASVLAGTTVLLAVLGVVYNPIILVFAVPFGVGTYLIWGDATGRIEARARRRSRARRSRRTRGRDGRRRGQAERRRRVADGIGADANGGRSRGRRSAPPGGGGLTAAEARRVLGVAADADETDIKRAYRERAKEVHPDQAGGDEEAFKRATEAYERLAGNYTPGHE